MAVNDHFYTLRRDAEGAPGYSWQGILGYVFTQPGPGRIALFRWWNDADHFYTVRPGPVDGWPKDGSIACYVMSPAPPEVAAPGSVPVYRFFSNQGDHYYSRDPGVPPEYHAEGMEFSLFPKLVPDTQAFHQFQYTAGSPYCARMIYNGIPSPTDYVSISAGSAEEAQEIAEQARKEHGADLYKLTAGPC